MDVSINYEVIYEENGRSYMTTKVMDFERAVECLRSYSKVYKNCRLLQTETTSKEIWLNMNRI